jgi:hypothetical protein
MKKPSCYKRDGFFQFVQPGRQHVNMIVKDKVLSRVRFLTILVNCFHRDGFCWFRVFKE